MQRRPCTNYVSRENGGQKTEVQIEKDLVHQSSTIDWKGRPELHCRGYRPSPVECHYKSTSRSEMTLPDPDQVEVFGVGIERGCVQFYFLIEWWVIIEG